MKRTAQQNKALHLYFTLLANELNEAGLDMKAVLKPEVDIPWTPRTVKEYLWRPVQKVYSLKKSTTELDTKEVREIYEFLNKHIGEKFGVHAPFPSNDLLDLLK